jgi:alkanesulfonate monooxygenase SsuD/methylene tetrahydromethanopterin reductase-like flavin-dependent oxidoreductase (luciferase family)
LRRVAKYGDGWFPSFVTPEEFKAGMEQLGTYGTKYGRTIEPGEAGVLILTYATRDRARAQSVSQKVFEAFPVPSEALAARCAIGAPEEVVEKVRAYVDAGCSKYVLWPISPPEEIVSQIELYGREIVPQFN